MAFPALEALTLYAPGSTQETALIERLRQSMLEVPTDQRSTAFDALGQTLAGHAAGPRLITRLATFPDALTRQLALDLASRLPVPIDPLVVAALRPLLLDRSIALEAHLAAAAVFLQSLGSDDPAAGEVLQALIAGLARPRALDHLGLLEERVGKLPVLQNLRERLEAELPMRCPRCPTRLPRPDMIKHLWLEHRLLLDGRRVREPWEVADDMLRSYATRKDAGLLARCFDLAEHADPDKGVERVRQTLRSLGVRNGDDIGALREEGVKHGASICPRCHALVPGKRDPAPRPLTVSRGRLYGGGYVVEVSEDRWRPWLEILTPKTVVYRGPEADQRWTPRAATVLLVGPPVLLAVLVALLFNLMEWPGGLPVTLLLWLAGLAAVAVRVRTLFTGKPLDRAVDHAWTQLAPRLHANGFDVAEADFLAGLALVSAGRGRFHPRQDILSSLLLTTEKALISGSATPGQLAALWRLTLEDAAALDRDPVPILARQLSRCLEAGLPLVLAHRLLERWESDLWSDGNLARLRALVCDRAFTAGFTVADLVTVGRAVPALGEVLQVEDADGLARLRLLWTLRESNPWTRIGPAQTVFELADHPTHGPRQMEQRPDLLLLPTLPETGPARRFGTVVELCTGGVRLGGTLLMEAPRTIEVKARVGPGAGGYDLIVGPYRFWFRDDPDELARRLERWCQWYFREFLPQLPVDTSRTSAVAARLFEREAVACPECRKALLPCVGEMGVPVEV
jgi:hypothetical protein